MPVELIEVEVEGERIAVPDVVLTLSSPVFKDMIEGDMKDSTEKLILLPGKSKEEFNLFVRFLDPATGYAQQVTPDNVEFLLRWSEEYQVESVKKWCEDFLLWSPVSLNALLQAHRFHLTRLQAHFCESLGPQLHLHQLDELLQTAPELLNDLLPHMVSSWHFNSEMIERIFSTQPHTAQQLMPYIIRKLRLMEGKNEDGSPKLDKFDLRGAEAPFLDKFALSGAETAVFALSGAKDGGDTQSPVPPGVVVPDWMS